MSCQAWIKGYETVPMYPFRIYTLNYVDLGDDEGRE
jgi:hypothetical protein